MDITAMIRSFLDSLAPAVPEILSEPNPNGSGALVAVRSGYTVQAFPGKQTHQAVHTFHDLASFAAWLNREVTAEYQGDVDILAGETAVNAALNPGDPYGDQVQCLLKYHPMFEAWRGVFGKTMDQKQFHAFVRGNLDAFPAGASSGVSEGDILATELQKLGVARGDKFDTELDPRGFYHFSGSTGSVNYSGNIPPRFNIVVPIIQGVSADLADPLGTALALPGASEVRYQLDILLSMDVTDKGAQFTLSCPALPIHLHRARLDAVAYLRRLLAEGFLVGLGDLKLADVPVVIP